MNKFHRTPVVIAIIILLWPIMMAMIDPYDSLPEGYFTLLRIIVCGVAVYLAVIAHNIKKLSWMWTMGFIAILFNPFIQIHLDEKSLWLFIDFVVSFTFFLGIFALSGEGTTKSIFKTRAFRIFRKIVLAISLCIVLIFIISGIRNHLKEKTVQRRIPAGFVLEKQRQPVDLLEHFDIKTARPVNGYFIETYGKEIMTLDEFLNESKRKPEIILIGNNRGGKADGVWRIYNKYGTLRAEKKYNEGILINVVVFDENGALIKKYPCKEGKIAGDIDPSDTPYVSDYDVATRESVSFVNMDYEDENIRAKLLPPYFLTLDNKKYLFFEIDIEAVNKTKIIKNIQPAYTVFFRDNFGNHFSVKSLYDNPFISETTELKRYARSKTTFTKEDLRFGDTGKAIFWTDEKLLKNSIYFNFGLNEDMFGNLNRINFVFPAFFIEEKDSKNIEDK